MTSRRYGSVQRVMLSIQGSDVLNYINNQKENGKEVNLGTNEGVYIAKVDEDGNGAAAGLKEGDVITKVDGKKVTKMAELQEVLNGKRPGDKMTITYLRNKKSNTKTITLKNAQGTTSVIRVADLDVLGGNFRPVTAMPEGAAQHQVWCRGDEGEQWRPEGCRHLTRIHHPEASTTATSHRSTTCRKP